MAVLDETVPSVYTTEIYQLEITDPVLGGEPDLGAQPNFVPQSTAGISNAQALQLANRTRWLKDQVVSLLSSINAALVTIGTHTTQIASLFGITSTHTTQITGLTTKTNTLNGGTVGQSLKKQSSVDLDYSWVNLQEVPVGGLTGQVLTKDSNTNYDTSWEYPVVTSESVLGNNTTGRFFITREGGFVNVKAFLVGITLGNSNLTTHVGATLPPPKDSYGLSAFSPCPVNFVISTYTSGGVLQNISDAVLDNSGVLIISQPLFSANWQAYFNVTYAINP